MLTDKYIVMNAMLVCCDVFQLSYTKSYNNQLSV
jgi:hypothetical protein